MAKLGRLWHSHDPQAGTAEQTRTEEAPHPNSVRAVIVGPVQLLSDHNVVIRWSMTGLEVSPTDVTGTDYLAGTECQDSLFQKSTACF